MRREKSWAHLREGIKGRALSFFFLFSFLCLSPSFSKGTEFGGGIGSRRKGWSRRGTRTRTTAEASTADGGGCWGRCSCDAEEAWGAVAAAYLGVAQEEELLGAEVQVGQRGLPTAP